MNSSILKSELKQKIVCLVPSITELLYALELEFQIIGITRFCVLPKQKNNNPTIIGGTKDFNVGLIKKLNPDIIIANKEENTKELIEELLLEFPVYITDIKTIDDSLEMILSLSKLFGKENTGKKMVEDFIKSPQKPIYKNRTCIYLIWNHPIMTIGGDTFINDMLLYAGFENCFKDKLRYPIITEEIIILLKPKYLFLSSEPYYFKNTHVLYYSEKFPFTKVVLVDGQMFSWYGSRILELPNYISKLKEEL